jgi:hypothetical protein
MSSNSAPPFKNFSNGITCREINSADPSGNVWKSVTYWNAAARYSLENRREKEKENGAVRRATNSCNRWHT